MNSIVDRIEKHELKGRWYAYAYNDEGQLLWQDYWEGDEPSDYDCMCAIQDACEGKGY